MIKWVFICEIWLRYLVYKIIQEFKSADIIDSNFFDVFENEHQKVLG